MPTATTTSRLTLRQLAERGERVFPSYPQVARYFPSAAIEDARQRLGRAIERGDGPGLVIGAPGTGKSLLLSVLAAQHRERFDIVLLTCARLCTRRALLQAMLFELGLPYQLRDEGELRLSLLDQLLSAEDSPAGLLLLVDEAQTLPIALLDELRVLTNLVRGGLPRVRLVLAGSSALEEAFASAELESFSQRLSARCYLAPFHREETTQFIRAQIAAAGGAPEEICTGEMWEAVFEATDGVPRLVSQLCDRALWIAVTQRRPQLDRQVIQAAWSDLQQLPAPWDTPPVPSSAPAESHVVEFGGLSAETATCEEGEAPAELWRDDVRLGESLALPCLETALNDEAALDVEPTELDDDGDVVERTEPAVARQQEQTTDAVADSADPFEEQFEEEEVVLDNFAAWDDMFRRDAPRVENRRDPGFATLVQAAIAALPAAADEAASFPVVGPLGDFDADALAPAFAEEDEGSDAAAGRGDESLASRGAASEWPGPRLAVVSEPVPPTAILPRAGASRSAPPDSGAFERAATPACQPIPGASEPAGADSSVLVIEEDLAPAPAKPPVRREEYRHLFSRLHSD